MTVMDSGDIPPFALLRMGHPCCCTPGVYSPERRMGRVGVAEPATLSMVMPKAFAGTPLGRRGSTSEA
jgi:hypothetical protein